MVAVWRSVDLVLERERSNMDSLHRSGAATRDLIVYFVHMYLQILYSSLVYTWFCIHRCMVFPTKIMSFFKLLAKRLYLF